VPEENNINFGGRVRGGESYLCPSHVGIPLNLPYASARPTSSPAELNSIHMSHNDGGGNDSNATAHHTDETTLG
jgi:hypothetical protein